MPNLPRVLSASSRVGAPLAATALTLALVLGGLPAAAHPLPTPDAARVAQAPSRTGLLADRPTRQARPDRADLSGSITTSDRAAVAAAYREVYLPAADVVSPDPDPASVAACDAGRPTSCGPRPGSWSTTSAR